MYLSFCSFLLIRQSRQIQLILTNSAIRLLTKYLIGYSEKHCFQIHSIFLPSEKVQYRPISQEIEKSKQEFVNSRLYYGNVNIYK